MIDVNYFNQTTPFIECNWLEKETWESNMIYLNGKCERSILIFQFVENKLSLGRWNEVQENLQCYVSVLEWRIKEVQRYLWLLSWKWAMTSHCVQMVRIKRGSWSKTGSTPPSMHGDRIGKYTSCYVLHLRWRDNQEQLPKIHYVATSSYVVWRKLLECIVSVFTNNFSVSVSKSFKIEWGMSFIELFFKQTQINACISWNSSFTVD